MKNYDILEALTDIDDECIENAVKNENSVKKRWLTIGSLAACFCLVLSLSIIIPYAINSSSQIPISNYNGNISIKYTNKSNFDKLTGDLLVFYTEQELFENTDCVFSGTIDTIKNIEINYDGNRVYKSLITIKTDKFYKGNIQKSTVTVLSAPISRKISTTDTELLSTLKEGEYGVFLANTVAKGTVYSESDCSFDASEICDAVFFDGVRFGFIKNADAMVRCCDTISPSNTSVFTSLTQYNWESVISYIQMQCTIDAK